MNGSTLRRGIVPAAIVLSLSLGLAACSSNSSSSPSSTSAKISCASGSIKASGSTAQKNAITEWTNNYQTACTGATINYQATGSGAGIKDFINNQVAFAGSDSALKPDELTAANKRCSTGPAIDIPMVVGPIAIAYNLAGVDGLTLTPQVLAKIFTGQITTWNDPAITAINSGVTLPSAKISVQHRSDASGTTANFAAYLVANAASTWTYGTAKDWPKGLKSVGVGSAGSDQVAASLKSTPNSIGYIEYSFTQEGNLGVAKIDNGGGAVELTPTNAGNAVAEATVTGTGNDLALKIDYTTKAADAYPIILVTYEITCQKGLSSSDQPLTKSFLTYTASTDGQGILAGLGYAPLPSSIISKVRTAVASIS